MASPSMRIIGISMLLTRCDGHTGSAGMGIAMLLQSYENPV